MEPTYKKLDENTLEVTLYQEQKIKITREQIEATKIQINAIDKAAMIAEQDALLNEFK